MAISKFLLQTVCLIFLVSSSALAESEGLTAQKLGYKQEFPDGFMQGHRGIYYLDTQHSFYNTALQITLQGYDPNSKRFAFSTAPGEAVYDYTYVEAVDETWLKLSILPFQRENFFLVGSKEKPVCVTGHYVVATNPPTPTKTAIKICTGDLLIENRGHDIPHDRIEVPSIRLSESIFILTLSLLFRLLILTMTIGSSITTLFTISEKLNLPDGLILFQLKIILTLI